MKYNEYNFHLHPKYIYKNKVSRHSSILHKLVVEVVGHNAVGNVTSRAQNLSASCEYLVQAQIRSRLLIADPVRQHIAQQMRMNKKHLQKKKNPICNNSSITFFLWRWHFSIQNSNGVVRMESKSISEIDILGVGMSSIVLLKNGTSSFDISQCRTKKLG